MCNGETCLRLHKKVYRVIEPEDLDLRTRAVVGAISAPRLGPYLVVAGGNIREAFAYFGVLEPLCWG